MKKIFKYIWIIGAVLSITSCNDDALETSPTTSVLPEQIFTNATTAQVAVDGIYRALFINGWSDSWSTQNPGMMATTLVKELQGEDHVQAAQGSGWFYNNYIFGDDAFYTNTSGHQFSQWNMYYTVVSQANYILAHEDPLVSEGSEGENVIAQAYTLRGLSYMALYEWFCLGNYPVNKEKPGVPIYTEPTTIQTTGKPRGTESQLFEQINDDFQKAVDYFTKANAAQAYPSHIDLYVAYGLWARAALIQEDWPKAEEYANAALSKKGLARVADMKELGNFNNASTSDILWGFQVITDQTGPYGPFLSHMDPEGGYGSRANHCIDAWLWNQIPETDARKGWWENPDSFMYSPYCQVKFRFSDLTNSLGDVLYLRAEEMILIAAEASCRQGKYDQARSLLTELGTTRDSAYEARLKKFTDSSEYNKDTHGTFTTLMDEILFQRRVELWGEGFGRAFDLRRLNLGYTRDYEGSNHPSKITLQPGDYRFVSLIPQKEFDSNSSLTVADQNPR